MGALPDLIVKLAPVLGYIYSGSKRAHSQRTQGGREPGGPKSAASRYGTVGRLDTIFGVGGEVFTRTGQGAFPLGGALAIQSDGEIVVVGSCASASGYEFCLARYNIVGSLDTLSTTSVGGLQSEAD